MERTRLCCWQRAQPERRFWCGSCLPGSASHRTTPQPPTARKSGPPRRIVPWRPLAGKRSRQGGKTGGGRTGKDTGRETGTAGVESERGNGMETDIGETGSEKGGGTGRGKGGGIKTGTGGGIGREIGAGRGSTGALTGSGMAGSEREVRQHEPPHHPLTHLDTDKCCPPICSLTIARLLPSCA
jgi:hypothetical protein